MTEHNHTPNWTTEATAYALRSHLQAEHGQPLRGLSAATLVAVHTKAHTSEAAPNPAPTTCAYTCCEKPIVKPNTGRPPKYCTNSHRKRAEQDRRRQERAQQRAQEERELAHEQRLADLTAGKQLATTIALDPTRAAIAIADWIERDPTGTRSITLGRLHIFLQTHSTQPELPRQPIPPTSHH